MQLFGDNFLTVRNKYVLPLAVHGIPREKMGYWLFKDVISTNIVSINKLSGKSLEIELNKEYYYKALYCDIELFLNKSIIQFSDFLRSQKSSPCWSFVTLYYLAFFSCTCFLRFLNRGYLFINGEQKKRIEDFYLAVYSTPINLDVGNYFFSFKEENASGNIVISLTAKGDGIHKLNWHQLEATLRDFIADCDADETVIYNTLLGHFRAFKTEFPSNLRNQLNYQGESSIHDFDRTIPYINLIDIDKDFVRGLRGLSIEETFSNKVYSTAYLAVFLLKFILKLYDEYSNRSDFGEDFTKERLDFLRSNNVRKLLDIA